MKKDDLLQLIIDARDAARDATPNIQQAKDALDPLLNQLSDKIQTQITELKAEINDMKTKVSDPHTMLGGPATSTLDASSAADDSWTVVQSRQKGTSTFASVVQQSVKDALNEDRCKCDVIISSAPDGGDDKKLVNEICAKMDFTSKPTDIKRLGPINKDRPRLMRVSFGTSFDARTFISSFRQGSDLPPYRLRPGKTKTELENFKNRSTHAYKLNEDARKNGETVSFSLRDNGDIWKFAKNESGSWRREKNWLPESQTENMRAESETPVSGNQS